MMTAEARKLFLLSRATGIGGSDIGSLLSNRLDVEYGCERNLWARLSAVPADNPEQETEPMTLGNILEPFVARAYANETGRRVEETGLRKHSTVESLQVHVDRIIHPAPGDARTSSGVLEIKAVGREMMRKINEQGMPIDYILQLNHGMLCHGLDWGEFAIGTREDLLPLVTIELAAHLSGTPVPSLPRTPRIVHFELDRNPDICDEIEFYAPQFWARLKNGDTEGPPRLEPEDPRCGRCVRRNWCQGAALMEGIEPEAYIPKRPDLAPLVEEYRLRVAQLEAAQTDVDETQDKVREALDKITAVRVPVDGGWKNILYRVQKGAQRIDGPAMKEPYRLAREAAIEHNLPGAELMPPVTAFFKTGSPTRPLRMSSVLPKKAKKKGEVPETDESDF